MTKHEAVVKIREILASFDASASHTVSGQDRPQVEEIFAPEHHAGALDPHVPIVLGARGTGKSFWAGVLGSDETRKAAANAYPRLGLERLRVRFGFIGTEGGGAVSRSTIDSLIPNGQEKPAASLVWRAIILRAVKDSLQETPTIPRLRSIVESFHDPEQCEEEFERLDSNLVKKKAMTLVIFDAIDFLADEHDRLRKLLDELLQVTWSMRSYRAIRVKLFLRNDQVSQLGLRFVELPKLIAGATHLMWRGTDLYGMLYERLASHPGGRKSLDLILKINGLPSVPKSLRQGMGWELSYDKTAQAKLFTAFAGQYMGRTHKKGKTYDWPLSHLSDGHSEVTPRSFLALMINAAKHLPPPQTTVVSAEGIRHGLREASKIRVEQLALEFPWIRRVLAPLARLQVPCFADQIMDRWQEGQAYQAILKLNKTQTFMLPFTSSDEADVYDELLLTLKTIGILTERDDGRYDMPDLFRVAARLLKKGGVKPTSKL